MPLVPGTRLGPYEILSPLGAGGMGEVWKARDTRVNRLVAIKTSLNPFSERFEREALAIAAVNHPHVCSLYDVGSDHLVMESVEGESLRGPLPFERTLELAEQILDALAAAHDRGIVHRDLKPGNILLTKSGVKVLDFGLAKMAHPAAPESSAVAARPAAAADLVAAAGRSDSAAYVDETALIRPIVPRSTDPPHPPAIPGSPRAPRPVHNGPTVEVRRARRPPARRGAVRPPERGAHARHVWTPA